MDIMKKVSRYIIFSILILCMFFPLGIPSFASEPNLAIEFEPSRIT